ncbi:hypothetical protein BC938DRAFT_472354 [Jimgerdemannia flammicorona]|uniref:REJ domain-containing protein n=1 Tax=Jimgerdemannia flammicorona TaxID=994334 RepID=A0A433Q686_9FUNG|nr:hypothetical protein BC938DRAFT_472354 [Jimgerdemannia flammicorona]
MIVDTVHTSKHRRRRSIPFVLLLLALLILHTISPVAAVAAEPVDFGGDVLMPLVKRIPSTASSTIKHTASLDPVSPQVLASPRTSASPRIPAFPTSIPTSIPSNIVSRETKTESTTTDTQLATSSQPQPSPSPNQDSKGPHTKNSALSTTNSATQASNGIPTLSSQVSTLSTAKNQRISAAVSMTSQYNTIATSQSQDRTTVLTPSMIITTRPSTTSDAQQIASFATQPTALSSTSLTTKPPETDNPNPTGSSPTISLADSMSPKIASIADNVESTTPTPANSSPSSATGPEIFVPPVMRIAKARETSPLASVPNTGQNATSPPAGTLTATSSTTNPANPVPTELNQILTFRSVVLIHSPPLGIPSTSLYIINEETTPPSTDFPSAPTDEFTIVPPVAPTATIAPTEPPVTQTISSGSALSWSNSHGTETMVSIQIVSASATAQYSASYILTTSGSSVFTISTIMLPIPSEGALFSGDLVLQTPTPTPTIVILATDSGDPNLNTSIPLIYLDEGVGVVASNALSHRRNRRRITVGFLGGELLGLCVCIAFGLLGVDGMVEQVWDVIGA